ncbi:MAG: hypothetical protein AB7E47_06305 [Desulfovibrionaceae bacterium]
MSACNYPCVLGELKEADWRGEAVVAFGGAVVDSAIPADKTIRIASPSPQALAELAGTLQLDILRGGIVFVLPPDRDSVDMAWVLETQKVLLHAHYKYILFPNFSHATADPMGVRTETIPDLLREINVLRNYPWLFSSPIADKLAATRLGMPVILLLPGPSIHEIVPHLPALRERCLVACIAKTVHACVSVGVMPDFVIQLDTFQMQRHYFDALPPMPDTVLVPLSIAPFHSYAHKFKGVVMMDSFNLELLPNRARLRESYVSSLTGLMGLAEALHAPHAFLAGANLSTPLPPELHPLWRGKPEPLPIVPREIECLLSSRDDTVVHGHRWYIATAVEADFFASTIAKTTGTRFYSTSDSTLLSRQWFPHMDLDAMLALPPLDRQRFQETMDHVLAQRETIDITKTRIQLLKKFGEIRQMARHYAMRGDPAVDTALRDHVYTKAAATMRDAPVGDHPDVLGVAERLCGAWRGALNEARLLVLALTAAKRGTPLPLLCMADEIEPLTALLARYVPGATWSPCCFVPNPALVFPKGEAISYKQALEWLAAQQAVFASPRMMREFAYILDLAPSENIFDLRHIAGANA